MKVIIVFFACVVLAVARPQQQQRLAQPRDAVIVRYESENSGNGNYRFGYETSDGQTRDEQAVLKNPGSEDEAISVTGSYSFVGPDGVLYTVKYIADENGFQPEGDHIPKPKLGINPLLLASLTGKH